MEDQDIKTVNEEPKVEEQQKEEPVQENSKPYQVEIEEARQDLYKQFNKQKRLSNIIMFAVLILIVGIMFMILSNLQWLKIVGYCSAGALVVGMIVYYVLTKSKFPNKTKEYIAHVSTLLRNRMFGKQYTDVKYDEEEKFAIADFASDGVYKDATGINSRNVIRATYKDHHLTYGEVALLRPSTRKQQVPPLFVGKYVTLPNNLEFDGRFVLVIKNLKEPVDLPNAIDDLVLLEEKENMAIYGPEGADFHKVLKGEFFNDLRKIKVENHLFNLNVVIWAGHSAAYLSYDDAIMSFPFDKPFDYEAYEQSFNDVDAMIRLLAGE